MPVTITITAVTDTKTYDGTNSPSSPSTIPTYVVSGDANQLQNGDIVYLSQTFESPNVGNRIKIIPTVRFHPAADEANYTVVFVNATGTIEKAPLSIIAKPQTTPYGTLISTLSSEKFTASGLLNNERINSITVNTNQTLSSKVGSTGITITPAGIIGGNSFKATNYTISVTPGNVTITPVDLTITADSKTTTYGTIVPIGDSPDFTYDGLISNDMIDTVTLTTTQTQYTGVLDANAIIIPSNPVGSNFDANNYNISYVNGTVTVTKKRLFITANNQTTPYGTVISKGAGSTKFISSGLVNSETIGTVTLNTIQTSSTNVGTTNVTITPSNPVGGTFNNNNYELLFRTGIVTITAALLTVNASDKGYDGTNTATIASLNGLKNSETLNYTIGATFDNANIANGKTVTVNSVLLSNGSGLASNYSVENGQTTTANITPAQLIITANDKTTTYGTIVPIGSGSTEFTSSGLINGETIGSVTLTTNQLTNTNAGTNSIVVIPSAATGGSFTTSNYIISYQYGNVTINKAPLTIRAQSHTKTYDGTRASTSIDSNKTPTYEGMMNGENFAVLTQLFDSANVSNNKTLTVDYLLYVPGNYDVTTYTASGEITPAQLDVYAENQGTTYGENIKTGTGCNSDYFRSYGLVYGDRIDSVTIETNYTTTTHVGDTTKTVTPKDATGENFTASNYSITYHNGNVTINQFEIIVYAESGYYKTYDGNDTANGSAPTYNPHQLVNGDTITLTQYFESVDALGENNSTLTVRYVLSNTTNDYNVKINKASGTIIPATVRLSAEKTYDGNNYFTGSSVTITELIGSETLNYQYATSNDYRVLSNGTNYIDAIELTNGTGKATNYQLPTLNHHNAPVIINKRALSGNSITSAFSTYGEDLSPGTVSFDNVVQGDIVSSEVNVNVSNTTDKSTGGKYKVGTYTQTASTTLSGSDSGNYSLSENFTPNVYNYEIKQLELFGQEITAAWSTYGDSLSPGTFYFDNVIQGDDVSSSVVTVNGSTKSSSDNYIVGTYTQSVTSTLSGADSVNYIFIGFESIANYEIRQRVLTVIDITLVTKTYGEDITPGTVSFDNAIQGDDVSTTANVNVSDKSSSGYYKHGTYTQTSNTSLSGADEMNYSLIQVFTISNYNINKRTLNITSISSSSSYYADLLVPGSVTFSDDKYPNDIVISEVTVNVLAVSTGGKYKVGFYTQTATANITGIDSENYSLSQDFVTSTNNYEIKKLQLFGLDITSASSIYGQNITPGTFSFDNAIQGDDVSSSDVTVNVSATSTSGNYIVGKYTQSVNDTLSGADSGNYSFNGFQSSDNYEISELELTNPSIEPSSSTYGDSLIPGNASFGNAIEGDYITSRVTVNVSAKSSGNKYIAGRYTQTASTTLSGQDYRNYKFNGFESSDNYEIIQRVLNDTAAIAPSSSVYADSLNPGSVSFNNAIMGDDVTSEVTVNVSATSTSGNYIIGTYYQTASATLTGTDSGNYSFNGFQSSSQNYTIDPLLLTGTTISSNSTVYGVTLAPGNVYFDNIKAGDDVSSSASIETQNNYSGNFLQKGTYKQSVYTISGDDSNNYSLDPYTTPDDNYEVTAASLTITARDQSNTYGSLLELGTSLYTSNGLFTGDSISSVVLKVDNSSTVLGTKYVGNYDIVPSIPSISEYGNGLSNYDIYYVAGTLTINQATLNIRAQTDSKIYDGTRYSNVTPTHDDLMNDETLTLTQSFDSANVSGNITLTVDDFTLTTSANYNIIRHTTSGSIITAPLTITAKDQSTTYGKNITTGTGCDYRFFDSEGLVNDETIGSVTIDTNYEPPIPVGDTTKTVTPKDATGGTFTASNYSITYISGKVIIAKFEITVNAQPHRKTYDGNDTANDIANGAAPTYNPNQLVNSDTITLTQYFRSKNALGENNSILTVSFVLSNPLDYHVIINDASGTIIPATVSLSAEKTYDGTNDLTGKVSITGLIDSEKLNYTTATSNDSHVASNGTNYINTITLTNGTDGSGKAANYQLPTLNHTNAPVTINKVTIGSLSATKIYDGTTSLTGSDVVITGLIGSETLNYTDATSNDYHVSSNSTNYISAITLTDGIGAASDYKLPTTLDHATASVTITAKSLTPSLTNTDVTKIYDANDSTSITPAYSFDGLVSGDNDAVFVLNNTNKKYNTSHVLTANKVTVSGLSIVSISGTHVSEITDYSLSETSIFVAATITPRPITPSITNSIDTLSKTYDGNDLCLDNLGYNFDGFFADGDSNAYLNKNTANFNSSHVLTANQISISGLSIERIRSDVGSQPSDYYLTVTELSHSANITAKTLTPTLTNTGITKTYDGTLSSDITPSYSFDGLVSGDSTATLSNTDKEYNFSHVSNASLVTVSGLSITGITGTKGSEPGDYSLSTTSVSHYATITAKPLTPTLTNINVTKTYDGNDSTTITPTYSFDGLISGDTNAVIVLNNTDQKYNSNHVSSANKVIVSGLTITSISGTYVSETNDYYLSETSIYVTATIRAKSLTPTLTNTSITKAYDGNDSTTMTPTYSFTGFISGDSTATLNNSSKLYNNSHVSTATTVTVSGLSITGITGTKGSEPTDYSLSITTLSHAATITAKTLTPTLTNSGNEVTKTYDRTTSTNMTPSYSFDGLVSGDNTAVFVLDNTGKSYDSSQVSNSRQITVSGLSITSISGGNNSSELTDYTLSTTTISVSARITSVTLNITANSQSTTYGSVLSLGTSRFTTSGLISPDSVSSVTLLYNSSATVPGTTNTGTYSIVPSNASGSGLSNYNINYNDGDLTINKATISIKTTNITKIYDGTTDASGNPVIHTGVLYNSDSLSGGTYTFDTANVGSGKTVTVSGVTVNDRNNGNNYNVSYHSTATNTINPVSITISIEDYTKQYDGNLSTYAAVPNVTVGQLYTNTSNGNIKDRLTGGSFVFQNANAGNNKTVSVSGVTINDGNNGNNYTVSYANNSTSTITKASISISTIDVVKTFDRTVSAEGTAIVVSGTLYTNVSNGNTLDYLSGGTFAFTTAVVGNGNKTVNVSNVTVNDGNSGNNYTVTYVPNTTSTIIPIPCFRENTKILTIKGYVPIQNLRKGDLIKTFRDGYMPIDMIGRKTITNSKDEINGNRMYVCTSESYPEIIEDLYITGFHSILVNNFNSPEQKEKARELLSKIYVTDGKYRLPACIDDRAILYEKEGEQVIYHLSLENDDYFMNYGIYANGLLVESSSKRYMKEFSKMKMLE
jgi:YDG domain/Hint domain/MBG domain (YGX type)